MRTQLLSSENIPDFDVQIIQFVTQQGESLWGSSEMLIGIQNNAGIIYRQIICEGMTEYMACVQFLPDLGLINTKSIKPFDDVFAKD